MPPDCRDRSSASSREGGADQALFGEFGPLDHIDDLLLVKDIDAVAEEELVVLRRVPEEGLPGPAAARIWS